MDRREEQLRRARSRLLPDLYDRAGKADHRVLPTAAEQSQNAGANQLDNAAARPNQRLVQQGQRGSVRVYWLIDFFHLLVQRRPFGLSFEVDRLRAHFSAARIEHQSERR